MIPRCLAGSWPNQPGFLQQTIETLFNGLRCRLIDQRLCLYDHLRFRSDGIRKRAIQHQFERRSDNKLGTARAAQFASTGGALNINWFLVGCRKTDDKFIANTDRIGREEANPHHGDIAEKHGISRFTRTLHQWKNARPKIERNAAVCPAIDFALKALPQLNARNLCK